MQQEWQNRKEISSLRSRRLEVVGERENGRARGRHPRVSPSRAPVFSCAHYFQAPATQAKTRPARAFKTPSVFLSCSDSDLINRKICRLPKIPLAFSCWREPTWKTPAREKADDSTALFSTPVKPRLDRPIGTSCSLKILGDYSPTLPPTA